MTPVETLATESSLRAAFCRDAIEGLSKPRKEMPCKYLYDRRGSLLFDQICELEEYYPTRTEMAIMRRYGAEMADEAGAGCLVVELGSGSSTKTRLLLDPLEAPAGYVPVEISRKHLEEAAGRIRRQYPGLPVLPVCADYTRPLELPADAPPAKRTLVYFPGSTIGNFMPDEARAFLSRASALAGPGGGVLIGVDLKKDQAALEAAYDDRDGVTAAFNLNLLQRMNRDLGADFDLDAFHHRAPYNAAAGRVEMHIVSEREQTVALGGHVFHFAEGETIWTESSHKYDIAQFAALAAEAGLEQRRVWTDPDRLFSVQYLEVSP